MITKRRSLAVLLAAGTAMLLADEGEDFGLKIQHELEAHSEQLFGVGKPVKQSAPGPYTGLDSANAVVVSQGLKVSVVSNATHPQNDMIALWPNDKNPTHLIVAVEAGLSDPAVQVVDLKGDPNNNVRTILTGLINTDPVRRTPWGTIVVGEEAEDGGLYEIIDPLSITTPAKVLDRATGQTSDPRVTKRKAVGLLAWEGIGIMRNGVMYYGDELRPSNGAAGGAIYKFVPDQPYLGSSPITTLALSPLASGKIYGMRLGTRNGNTDYGQGSETGKGIWVPIDSLVAPPDINGNIALRAAQEATGLTGYYRPEDLEIDPLAVAKGIARVCWANTGRMTNGGTSAVEGSANYGEILCMIDEGGTVPFVTRLFAGDPDANHFDNVAFQPQTGTLAVLEDGEVATVKANGTTELRGNDIWLVLPDGGDRDVQSDGAIRILSLKDTSSEPSGLIFDASGRNAYVHLQHRSTGLGAVLKISGFKVDKKGNNDD